MAQRQNVQVNLQFTADTGKARAQLQQLTHELEQITKTSVSRSDFGIDKQLQSATKSATELLTTLEKSTNVDTGKLDLGKFTDSLKRSGKTLEQYRNDLVRLGPQGSRAFEQLAQSIMTAETPLRRTNKMLDEFWANLKKTAGWTISSSIINNFWGGLQKAYGYAQDLNKSLNDIRIVTGYSTNQMAEFAKNANTAAKALSTTTTNYTNASLIYYQQGLTDKEVIDRTNVTVKMANAAGVSAEEVSQQLTAVWNNFYDGSKSLEYYADVMTALGAATASSTDEISEGLEKFASVADTIGLSYEYATASLATITATTRESANVVGTALKTLFSRIQGLKLGETLEDGTDLNKYSEALNKVGISIFDQNHQLKEMDDILDEMGNKWDTLAQDQKMALAQTVAGVRQYTQLVTLMDKWDYFQENLGVATGATGALDTQAETYAESWEAANKRIQASAESIYRALLNDEFFIKLTNFGADALDVIKEIIDGMGGVEGILLTVGAVATRVFNKQLAQGARDAIYNIRMLTGTNQKESTSIREQAGSLLSSFYAAQKTSPNPEESALANAQEAVSKAYLKYVDAAGNLSDDERRIVEHLFDQLGIMTQQTAELEKQANLKRKISSDATRELKSSQVKGPNPEVITETLQGYQKNLSGLRQKYKKRKTENRTDYEQQVNPQIQELENFISSLRLGEQVKQDVENDLNLLKENLKSKNLGENGQVGKLIKQIAQTILTRENFGTFDDILQKDSSINESYKASLKNLAGAGQVSALTKSVQKKSPDEQGAYSKEELKDLENYIKKLKELTIASEEVKKDIAEIESIYANLDMDDPKTLQDLSDKFTTLFSDIDNSQNSESIFNKFIEDNFKDIEISDEFRETLRKKFDAVFDEALTVKSAEVSGKGAQDFAEATEEMMNTKVTQDIYDMGTAFVSLGFSIGGSVNAVQNLISTWGDGELAADDFFSAVNLLGQGFETFGSLQNAHKSLTTITKNAVDAGTAFGKTGMAAKIAGMSFGTFSLYVLAAVAAIGAIVVVGKLWSDWYNQDAIAAKKAAEAAKKLNETADETKQKFDSLKSSFDAYDTAIEKLNSCVKGTQEWRDALSEVNNEVLNILQNHPELASKLVKDAESGGFTQESINAVLEELDQSSKKAQAAALIGNINASEKQLVSDTTNFNRKNGALWSSYIVDNISNYGNLTNDELANKARELANSFGLTVDATNQWVEEIVAAKEEIDKLANSSKELDLQIENNINALASQQLGKDYDVATQEFASEAAELAYQNKLDEIEGYLKWYKQGEDNIEAKKVWGQYQEATDTTAEFSGYNIFNRKFTYYQDGKKETISADEVAATIAASTALEELGASAKEATKIFSQLGESQSEIVKSYFATGGFDNISQEQLSAYNEKSETEIIKDLKLDELAKSMGFEEGSDEYNEWIQNFINGLTSIDFESIGKDLSVKAQKSFESIQDDLGKLSANEQAKVADWIQSAYEQSGEAGAQEAASAFKDITTSLGKDAHKLDEAFESINWNSIDNINDLKDNLIALEIPVDDLSNTELQALIDAFYKVGEAAGFAANATKYATLQDIKEAVGSGSNLSEEQYKQIPDTLKYMFQVLADGTYKFTGALADFNAEMDKASEADHKKRIAELQSDIEYLESLDENTINERRIIENSSTANDDDLKYLNSNEQAILKAQLGYLKENGFENANRYSRELIDNGGLTKGQLDEIAAELDKLPFAKNGEYLKSLYKELEHDTNAVLASQKNLNKVFSTAGTTETKKMAAGLVSVASEYESCQDEINRYHQLVAEGKEDTEEAAEATMDLANALHAAEFDKAAKDLTEYQEKLAGTSGEDAVKLASEMAQTFNELFGTTIDSEFILAQQDLIDKISKATGEEQKRLIANLEGQAILKTQEAEIKLSLKESGIADVESKYSELVSKFTENPITIDVNGNVDFTQVFAQLQALGIAGAAVADILTGLGATKFTMINNETGSTTTVEAHRVKAYQSVGYEITGATGLNTNITPIIPDIPKTGGGSGPSEYKKTSKDEVLDRYKEEDDRLDDINDALDDYNRLMDRSYGQGRLNQMAKVKKALAEEKKAIEDKKAKALEYLQVDKEALEQTAKQHGVDFNIDDNGNITNYTETMENLFKQLEAAEAKANSFTSKEAQDKYIEASITPIKTKIEELKEVIAQYEETRELIEDLENEWEEVRDKEYANNYAELSYKIELRVELNEMDMDLIEYRIAQLGEDFFKSEEILALMRGDKLNNLTDGLQVQKDAFNDLQSAIVKDEITQADYVEGLKEAYQSTMDLVNAVLDLDKEMLEYYSNTLDKANEELDKYTNNLEHLTGVLDHYKNIMGIIGKETDYEAMGKIMDARVITTRNELDIAKKNYAMMAEEVDKWAAKMNEATGEKELELYTKNWEAANEKMQEAQEEMLSKTEAWAEAMREQIENALNLENRNLEKILTGEFGNFDSLITSMDRAQSLQDNYLTETNKIYELDKLVNKAQQEIDKTNNQIAKQKLKAYMEETEELENVNQLSKYNLEIQQAKLDLVLAEIALEEAQNAKSVVRLSRDSEGNYGYVYTADQNKIAQAEQDFADAQNKLYNIGLRGSTEFAEKYAQTLQEMYDTLGQLQEQFLNGEFENEKQYNEAVASAKQFYFAQLKAFQDDYTLSFTTHDEVRTDSWGTSYETMIDSTQEWEDAVNQNIENVSDQFSLWEELSTEASENIKEGLDEVTESSEALTKQIEDEILPAIEDEIDLVGDLTAEYAELRDELVGVANDYLRLAEAIREALAAEQNKDRYEKSQKDAETVKTETPPGSGDTAGNTGNGGQKPFIPQKPDETKVEPEPNENPAITAAREAYYKAREQRSKLREDQEQYSVLTKEMKKWQQMLNRYGASYDTGGYTGVWGPDGRWALLHQKELVLNQDDTSNILSAVGIIRHIIDSIDLQSAYQRLAAPSASFFGAVSGGQAIDQNVSIEATFPNVQDRHEIEEAFNNLINTASQYAFRK